MGAKKIASALPAGQPGEGVRAGLKIAQADNFNPNFGDVLRSSAIFYYRRAADFGTTISFMDYWKAKRALDVAIVASTRDMGGLLVRRERLSFDRGAVINHRPALPPGDFEGSVEIEVFATRNMVIPYSAIMAVYESGRGLSMVHSYARTYSRHEVEEGRTISVGEESCWTLRDDERTRSFCVFHNGGCVQPGQQVTITVANAEGQRREIAIALPALAPYATVKLVPSAHLPDLRGFLAGRIGHASVSFRVGESFTRMLVGNEAVDGSDCQVTHSNFNYARHQTDGLAGDHAAFMRIPRLGGVQRQVLVYPDCDPGAYDVEVSGRKRAFSSGDELVLPVEPGAQCLVFHKHGGQMPTRIVTALVCDGGSDLLAAECSLGVLTHLQPPKRMWWGLCAADRDKRTALVIHDVPEIYPGIPHDATFTIRLFSCQGQQALEARFSATELQRFDDGVDLQEIFPEAAAFLDGDFGYYMVQSEYGGLTCYSLMRNQRGGLTLEHGF
jgi:hypothetical protein